MDDTALFKQLLTYVRTKEEVFRVKEALDLFISYKFSLQENVDAFAKLSPVLDQLLKSVLSKEQNIENMKTIVDQLNAKLNACPVIHITIAFIPTESTIEKLSLKVKQIFEQDSILDISVNPDILGGIIFIYNGGYQDLSIKKKLADAFNTRREEIKSLIYKNSFLSKYNVHLITDEKFSKLFRFNP